MKVLSSEHLLMATSKNANANKNDNNNNNNKTKNENVNLPKYRFPISATSRDLVKRCILAKAEKRLTGVEILEHPFFDVVWAAAAASKKSNYGGKRRQDIFAANGNRDETRVTTPQPPSSATTNVGQSKELDETNQECEYYYRRRQKCSH